MSRQITKSLQKGFTLIELLIVVVILGILAAVVVPQLSGATDDARLESLKTSLSNMRSAIDLYKQEHTAYPGELTAVVGTCPSSGTVGTGAATTAAAFAEQLTMYTDITGKACSTTDATYKFGPYLKTAQMGTAGIPSNPFTLSNDIAIVTAGNLSMSGSDNKAWKYDYKVGKFISDDSTNGHDTL